MPGFFCGCSGTGAGFGSIACLAPLTEILVN